MKALKMHGNFINILKQNNMVFSTERNAKDACSISYFHIEHPGDTHPDHWEIHPCGDELLFVINGELDIEVVTHQQPMDKSVSHNPETEIVTVKGGESLIVKKGHWHRVVLKKATDLVVAGFRENSKLAPVV